jgi:hypothetical protein
MLALYDFIHIASKVNFTLYFIEFIFFKTIILHLQIRRSLSFSFLKFPFSNGVNIS